MDPSVVSGAPELAAPPTTSAFGNVVSEVSGADCRSPEAAPHTSSALQGVHVARSPNYGRPRMAANLSPPTVKSDPDQIAQLKEVGMRSGLVGRELAEFIAGRVGKQDEVALRLKMEKDEKLAQIQGEREERELRRQELILREEELRRMSEMNQELFRLVSERADARSNVRQSRASDGYKVRLPEFDDRTDVDQFLSHFEKVATLHGWDKECWGVRLVPLLRGVARDAYLQMAVETSHDYDEIKATLRQRFRRDQDYYRRQFRELKRDSKETFPQFLSRLRAKVEGWAESAGKNLGRAEEVMDLFLQEQLFNNLHGDLETRVREEQVSSVDELAGLAQRLLEAKLATKGSRGSSSSHSHRATAEDKGKASGQGSSGTKGVCHLCKKPGHYQRECPSSSKLKYAGAIGRSEGGNPVKLQGQTFVNVRGIGEVNGRPASFLRDTGASMCMVSAKFVQPGELLDRTVCIQLANRQKATVPWAKVKVACSYMKGEILAAVLPELITDFIIGNEVSIPEGVVVAVPFVPPDEPRMKLWKEVRGASVEDSSDVAVVTRSQSAKEGGGTPLSCKGFGGTQMGAVEFKAAQQSDPTLARIRDAATSGKSWSTGDARVSFQYRSGVLERVYEKRGLVSRQVCVPATCRKAVMGVAHDAPMAGHLGNRKTRERVWAEFYWPGMCADIRRYCQSCDRCQKFTQKGRVTRVPLERVPLVDTPFKKVAIDLVGPLFPTSDRGKRYILVMVDYATRYPEACALRNIDTESVAEALWDMWSRVGIPEEVLSDRGTQFTSNVMQEVYRLLSVKGLKTSPYHAQANGLVERFNGTLKSMLKKLCQEQPKAWDRFLPAALFAYREVPQATTGFSPFELLFGRTVRGPMSVLRSLWTNQDQDEEVKHASAYVCDLRNRIEETCKVAQAALERGAQSQKRHFDRRAKPRSFSEGEEVLLLLPESNNKLQMSWKGPFKVIKRVSACDYQIKVRGNAKLFHANLLKKYVRREPEAVVPVAEASVVEEKKGGELSMSGSIPTVQLVAEKPVRRKARRGSFRGPCSHERCSIRAGDVLTDSPQGTVLEDRPIRLFENNPVQIKRYPLPFSKRRRVRNRGSGLSYARMLRGTE